MNAPTALPHTRLIVIRDSDRDLKFRGIEILVDGNFNGNLNFGDSLEIALPPGSHRLKATNRLKSKTIELNVMAGETVHVRVIGIVLAGVWVLMSMLGTVAYRIELERVDG